jgi:hypothetical protein
MEWLDPTTGLFAAAAAVPLLVLMYFLRLRRREMPISSTLLWKRAVQDLQVNAPFQKLRRNLLLLLQLLALVAALVALARPVLSLQPGAGKRYVLLIDRSASMNAADCDGGRTRLAEARRQAERIVDSLRRPSVLSLGSAGGDEAMVVAFDRHARVMCNFTGDKAQLRRALEAVEPADASSHLAEAVAVARAFATSPGEEANNRSSVEPAMLELFSDGRIADLSTIAAGGGELRYHRIGSSGDNVAVTEMQARRSYERAEEVQVFATASNFGDKPVTTDVELVLDNNVRAVRRVELPAAKAPTATAPAQSGEASVSFVLTHASTGVIGVRQTRKDALAADDTAWSILAPPRRLRVLLVTPRNVALEAALRALPLAGLDVIGPSEFDDIAAAAPQRYDVIVLDGHVPPDLPAGRYVVFNAAPLDFGVKSRGEIKSQIIVDWRSRHPILQFVNLEDVFASKAMKLELPRDAAILAEMPDAPAMALLHRKGSAMLLCAFDVLETNWPFESSFVLFCYNATRFLGLETGQQEQTALHPGEAIELRTAAGASAKVRTPDGRTEAVAATPGGVLRFPGTARAGVYAVEMPGREKALFAVNVLDRQESRIAPAEEIVMAAETIQAATTEPRRTNRELWPYLVLAALLLACLEWVVYNSRVRL